VKVRAQKFLSAKVCVRKLGERKYEHEKLKAGARKLEGKSAEFYVQKRAQKRKQGMISLGEPNTKKARVQLWQQTCNTQLVYLF
jgi:hypothetical protein